MIELFLFKTMQLACIGAGVMLMVEAVPHLLWRRGETITMTIWSLASMGFLLGASALFAFWQRIVDKVVVWFGYDLANGGPSVVAMFLFFSVMWWFHAHLHGRIQTTLIMAGLVLSGSFGLTILETYQ